MASFTTLSARRAEFKQTPRASTRARAQGTQPDTQTKIYLGKGQFIDDDPSKYPDKDEWGTGGWAGGEQGLQKFVAQSQLEEAVQKEAVEVPSKPGALGTGEDTIYVGKGQYIKDDARMYPSKEDVGPLTGSAGGFAGGERGLQQFIRTQSLQPASPEQIRERQTTKDAIATVGTAALAGASYIAYLFLTSQPLPDVAALTTQLSDSVSGAATGSSEVGVPPVPGAVPSFGVPPVSEVQIKVAAAVALVVGSIVGGKIAVQKTKNAVADTADSVKSFVEQNLVRALVFGAAAGVYYALLV